MGGNQSPSLRGCLAMSFMSVSLDFISSQLRWVGAKTALFMEEGIILILSTSQI